jgi:hypothetical protein
VVTFARVKGAGDERLRTRGFIAASPRTLFSNKTGPGSQGFTLHPTDEDPSAGAPAWAIFVSSLREGLWLGRRARIPQGLKPLCFPALFGTTEVVPFHDGFKLTHYPSYA